MSSNESDPRAEYETRLAARRAGLLQLQRSADRISVVRLVLFGAAAALVYPALFRSALSPAWILVPLAAFGVAVVRHAAIISARERLERAVAFYEGGLARLTHAWAGRGNAGERFRDERHPYSADLDLFGRGSLFELLCAARTAPGEAALARWLLGPADPATIRTRQEAVRELAPDLDLREELAIVGDEIRGDVRAEDLAGWARTASSARGEWPAIAAGALGGANVATLLAALALPAGWIAFAISVTVSAAFALAFRSDVREALARADRPEHELELLSRLLSRLERRKFRAPLLAGLRASLATGGRPASARIARLARLIQVNDSRRNMLFAPLSALLLLGTQIAFAVERWRRANGLDVERWVEATAGIEALCSVARRAYERPADPFPEIVDSGPCFDGQAVGHPLLPEDGCVPNDVRLGDGLQVLLVSGSNMSGKSTLLRTVGVNTVLALAGAPVRAARLRVSPLAVGAAMRVTDSLQEGLSHFYAEIKRLRAIVELGRGERPLLFLLDEILQGTNSHDRRIGAEAVIRALVVQGGIGLVTTHDLALARIADALAPRAANVHFEDHLEGERIAFDYRLRPGVVERGNALGLMRAIGLPVP